MSSTRKQKHVFIQIHTNTFTKQQIRNQLIINPHWHPNLINTRGLQSHRIRWGINQSALHPNVDLLLWELNVQVELGSWENSRIRFEGGFNRNAYHWLCNNSSYCDKKMEKTQARIKCDLRNGKLQLPTCPSIEHRHNHPNSSLLAQLRSHLRLQHTKEIIEKGLKRKRRLRLICRRERMMMIVCDFYFFHLIDWYNINNNYKTFAHRFDWFVFIFWDCL